MDLEIKNTILVRYSELFLKGKNKRIFENILLNNIKDKLSVVNCEIKKISGRYLISNYDQIDETKILKLLGEVFGIFSYSPTIEIDTDLENLKKFTETIELDDASFRVTVNRADKTFPLNSTNLSAELGEIILNNNPKVIVDLHKPKQVVYVDIRENHKTYIYYKNEKGLGGMPIGSSSSGLLLLSGGIDSPVAGYQMAKRGMKVNALHFYSYPYTSQMAKDKVIELAKILKKYVGEFDLIFVPFTKIQESIHKNCLSEYMITIMRRIMMRIAERLCLKDNLKAIITGESLGQVASQTIESITVTNEVLKIVPALRPLIALDKVEITEIAERIGTFQTSILPYEDCCTVFLPKFPIIKPKLEKVILQENHLDIESLINDAINEIEVVHI